MPEWSNGPVSKSGVCHRTEGSNPSLSLKQIRNPLWVPYLFHRVVLPNPRRGFDKTRESEANIAGFEIAVYDRNPEGDERNEVSPSSNPSLSFETKSEAVRLRFLFQVK